MVCDGLVDALKARRLSPVAALERFDGAHAVLADGTRVRADAVIAATGYRRALEPLVGHLGILNEHGEPSVRGGDEHPDAPGLHFVGYSIPLNGQLPEMAADARAVARAARRPARSYG